MAARTRPVDIESLRRSLAMAPLSTATVVQLLDDHEALLGERDELEALLGRLLASWGECRTVQNELAKRLG